MEEQRYEVMHELGSGNFAVTKLAKNIKTGELVAIKYIQRGDKIGKNVEREIINHRFLSHPHIINFKEARYFFQQLISGVYYLHSMQISHRDLKLENTLLDGSPAPRLKICDFGFSKSALLHTKPKSVVGSIGYVAPEVFSRREYDGKNIMDVQYSIPGYVRISAECRQLLSSIFVADPAKNLPREVIEADKKCYKETPKEKLSSQQSVEEIMRIVEEAKTTPRPSSWDSGDFVEVEFV
ncbi:hypothetical protein TSUD_226470 [Trifolium subterraneum]|uniref:Protein kinase domain-containing protein n=1 Tax=Trifolium subterraneum TaxID=3900 RepID=A0A2Z6M9Z2_TRISU|nr:hypothetical protein TSUD_226470 [Trifolium subterraneum]